MKVDVYSPPCEVIRESQSLNSADRCGENIEPDPPTAGTLPDTRSHPVSSFAGNDQHVDLNGRGRQPTE